MNSSSLPTLGLVDEKGQPRPETWADLLEARRRVSAFVRSIGARFPARQTLLEKLMYALCMGEHLLVYGPTGTGKTGLVETVIGNITGAVTWSTDLSRSMADVQLFGDFDSKVAQETGVLMHRIEGSMLEAQFLNLGEFFDANTPLLRALLRVLNERQFRRGAQRLNVPLLTAIGNTNAAPAELLVRDTNDTLGAVVDRFLFHESVQYLVEPDDRRSMLRFRAGMRVPPPIIPVTLADIQLIISAIEQLDFVVQDAVLCAYEEIARLFARERGRPVSDRRLAQGIDVLEASAILRGSVEGATWEDLHNVSLILVDNPNDQGKFEEVAKAVVERARDETAQEATANESASIDLIANTVSLLRPDEIMLVPEEDLVKQNRAVRKAIQALQGFVPTTQSAKDYRRTKLKILEDAARLIRDQFDNVGSGL